MVLVALVLVLGPLIKRFGRTYAGDVFRANPRTGRSYLVLMDIAYYLIFSAYILLTINFSREPGWGAGSLRRPRKLLSFPRAAVRPTLNLPGVQA